MALLEVLKKAIEEGDNKGTKIQKKQ